MNRGQGLGRAGRGGKNPGVQFFVPATEEKLSLLTGPNVKINITVGACPGCELWFLPSGYEL